MAEYKKLLYSVGGGIISDAQLDAQNGSATIAIGLGGTGKDAIKRLKKEVYQRIAPDNAGESVAQYSHIKYLSIDTDDGDLWNKEDFIGIDYNTEFFSIKGDTTIFTDPKKAAMRAGKAYAKWLNCSNISLQSTRGAGGVRQIGRFFLNEKSAALMNKLDQVFTAAVTESEPKNQTKSDSENQTSSDSKNQTKNEVNIHIMTGLGGGTGAGTFLDVCYIVREAAERCAALNGKSVKICGYFFMPDVNLSKVAQNSIRNYIMYNSFCVMKELDYCMNLLENGDKWDQQYDGFRITTPKPPVDIAYLVSSQSVSGTVNGNGYEYAMGVVSDYVVQFISDNAINMDTHIANYANAEATLSKPYGGNYKYVIIGASQSVVPMREIATYLTSKLFEKMTEAWSNEPTDADIAELCEKIGLTCDKLKENVGSLSINVQKIDNVYDELSTDDSGDKKIFAYVLPSGIYAPFANEYDKNCGKFKTGSDALINEWKPGMNLGDNPISIVCRVFKALDEVVLDTKRGPIYAAKMLFGSGKKNIINIISGVQETAVQKRDKAFNNMDLTVRAVKQARTEYNEAPKHSLIRKNKKECFEDLINAINNDTKKLCEYKRYDYLCDALATAKKQLTDLYNNYFKKYADVMLDLQIVFAANKLAIAELKDVNSDPFTLHLFNISEVRSTLDAVVENLGIDTEITKFNSAFYQGQYNIWHSGSEDKISRWISKYMSEEFKTYIGRSLDAHIRSMYPDIADDIPTLTATVRTNIIQQLDNMASELFLLDGDKATHVRDHANTYTYCSAPDTALIVKSAIEQFKGANPNVTIVSGSKDRIMFLKSSPCVPMFAYGQIDVNYAEYKKAKAVTGKHLYEGAAASGDDRDWQMQLPNLRPYSIYKDIDWKTPEKKATAEAYGAAENIAGIIHSEVDNSTGKENGHYYIWRTPDYMPQLKSAKELADEAQKIAENEKSTLDDYRNILEKLNKVQNNLKSYKEGLIDYKFTYVYDAVNDSQKLVKPEVPPISIRNDGDKSTDATAFGVRRDHVLASPVLMKVVKEELDKVNKYNEVMAQLAEVTAAVSDKANKIENGVKLRATELPAFFNALFSGVITYRRPHTIEFVDVNKFGIKMASIELSKPSSEPFGGIAPLYQAFNTYYNLPDETRSSIREKVNQRLNGVDENNMEKDWTEVMSAACNNSPLNTITSEYINDTVRIVAQAVPEYTDIMNLYIAFISAKGTFKNMYGL
mgnify:CR=1 FL=1